LDDIEKYFHGGAICNYLSNHDFSRAATRLLPDKCPEELRTTVLRQLMAITLSLPGSSCIYQGEELGLPDARIPEDIPEDKMQDRLDKKNKRDISRAPMPWNSNLLNAGFSSSATPYLPMPESYTARAVNLQEPERASMLNSTRRLIAERQNNPALQIGATHILDTPEPIFAFTRQCNEQTILFVSNMSPRTVVFKAADYLDKDTLEKLHIPLNATDMIIGSYDFSRRGVMGVEKPQKLTEEELKKDHKGKKIFAADMLLADVLHKSDHADQFAKEIAVDGLIPK
jgi:glycosidase